MFHISSFHDIAMVVVLFVMSVVMYVGAFTLKSFMVTRSLQSSEILETMWTVLPSVVLACLAAPSLVTLYMSEESVDPFITLKVVGHQWFWSYEYGDSSYYSFDSYMIPTEDMEKGFRLLECDTRTPVPLGVEVKAIVTSSDVIHSWSVPSIGLKVDAIPGRLNQAMIICSRPGVIYGQCSEICGSFHSFMPIAIEVLPVDSFVNKFFHGIM